MRNFVYIFLCLALPFVPMVGCNKTPFTPYTEIEYFGTKCALSDSASVAYHTELAAAYQKIDSSALATLKDRGPKNTRVENEDISDEYKGARQIMEDAKEAIQPVIFSKHCVTVDRYKVSRTTEPFTTTSDYIDEFQVPIQDTAKFHAAKRAYYKVQ